jgi:membrane protease YdiL (CAAX protease family)
VFFLVLVGSSGFVTLLAALLGVPLVRLAPVYMFTPLTAAFITAYLYDISLASVGVSGNLNRWFLLAWVLPVFIVFGVIAVSLVVPGVRPNSSLSGLPVPTRVGGMSIPPLVSLLVTGVIAGPTINAIFAVGEEVGWRGLLLYELRGLGFWRASVVIGVVWGLWHTPLILQGFNYPEHPVIGVGMMVVFTVLLTPLLSYVRLKAESVFAAAVFHGTVNGLGALSVIAVSGGSNLTVGITGVSGFIVLFGMNLVLWRLMTTRDSWSIRQVPG